MGSRLTCKMETSGSQKQETAIDGMQEDQLSVNSRPNTEGLTRDLTTRGDELAAEEYLKKHKISDVLSILTSSLVHAAVQFA